AESGCGRGVCGRRSRFPGRRGPPPGSGWSAAGAARHRGPLLPFDGYGSPRPRRQARRWTVRIVSLLPSATEILFALGAGDRVVGVTFECDYPPEARQRRIVSTSTLPEGLSPAEVDRLVAGRLAAGEDLYRLDRGALAGLDADLVVTQDLCAVCAVDVTEVEDALEYLGCRARVHTSDPHTVAEILDGILDLGRVTGHRDEAERLVAGLRRRLHRLPGSPGPDAPRVVVLEWTDPPFAPGHWVPEMVTLA